jgi:hypothetical protein
MVLSANPRSTGCGRCAGCWCSPVFVSGGGEDVEWIDALIGSFGGPSIRFETSVCCVGNGNARCLWWLFAVLVLLVDKFFEWTVRQGWLMIRG